MKCKKCDSILQYLPPTEPSGAKEEHSSLSLAQAEPAAAPYTFEKICTDCQYPLLPDAASCPLCGAPVPTDEPVGETIQASPARTNRRQPSCRMKMIRSSNMRKSQTLTFSGEQIVLNRDNLDPSNHSLCEKAHALLEYENDKWYIQDKSEHCTTFIRAASKTELKPGDIIVMGNQRFEFG